MRSSSPASPKGEREMLKKVSITPAIIIMEREERSYQL